ncbi:MAG: CHAT domain-containing protein [Leptolyngbyaceae cyanobacterium MO_188.B28]|nr:CHAT domain-containing protein [Leptolyngbyaceae cyanobacterium MO_188.B28]
MNSHSPPKSILLLAANPKGTKGLRLQEEERDIKERLRLAGYGRTPINSTGATRARDIQQAMLDFKPQIVHFSGHGAGQDGLVFEDAAGQEKLVSSDALADLFRLFSNRVECVVLNACYTKPQAEAIARHVDYVIGMSQEIGDRAAIEFAVGFYAALGAGETIEFAYELGCNAIRLEGISEYLTPVIYKKSELIKSEFNQGDLKNDQAGRDVFRGQSKVSESSPKSINQPRQTSPVAPQSIPHPESQNSSKNQPYSGQTEVGSKIASEIIDKLLDVLSSQNPDAAIQKFEAIAHKSLFPNGKVNLSFLKNNFNVAFSRVDLYKRPVKIVDIQPTGRTRLGFRSDKESGVEEKYAIARSDNSKGLDGHIRIFFPANGGAAKISGMSL